MKNDFVKFIMEFHSKTRLSKSITYAFLTLIPKKKYLQGLDDYCPIFLVRCLHKVLSIILSSRMKRVLGSLISNNQSIFVSGRQLLDEMLVANEIVDFATSSKKKCLLFKVNFENAYDCVSWEFLRYMLKKMGFGCLWLSWMEECVFASHLSVLVNRSPTKKFKEDRGLRHGDPLSPFLSITVVEGLTCLLKNTSELGEFAGFNIHGRCNTDVLQFIDDTFVIGEVNWSKFRAIKALLRGFDLISSLESTFIKAG